MRENETEVEESFAMRTEKGQIRKKLEQQIEDFFSRNGKIQEIKRGTLSGEDKKQMKKRCMKSRIKYGGKI